ncbi:hypothetical protein [Actinomadura sp. K4S16]|nr:hypothetical protein [Actinomadura sp. K4S16]
MLPYMPDRRPGQEQARYWRIRTVLELVKSTAWLVWVIMIGGHIG